MCTNSPIFHYVLVTAERATKRRLADEGMRGGDKDDVEQLGREAFKIIAPRIRMMIEQLQSLSGCNFHVRVGASHQVSVSAQASEDIVLDYAVLAKPIADIARVLAHEWAHMSLGHMSNAYWLMPVPIDQESAEQEADFFSGVFLGAMGYPLDELIDMQLGLPQEQEEDAFIDPQSTRAYYVALGHAHGVARRELGWHDTPELHVFGRAALESAMQNL